MDHKKLKSRLRKRLRALQALPRRRWSDEIRAKIAAYKFQIACLKSVPRSGGGYLSPFTMPTSSGSPWYSKFLKPLVTLAAFVGMSRNRTSSGRYHGAR